MHMFVLLLILMFMLQKIAEEGMQGVDCVRTVAVLRREDMLLDLHTVRTHFFVKHIAL
jgi:hypothetical protein